MATLADNMTPNRGADTSERAFFRTMATIICFIIVAGFSMQLALGRSTFAVPIVIHVHAVVFFGWVALYLAQNWLIAGNNVALHRRLGKLAYVWVPVMVAMGFAVMVTALRRTGAPFFFDQNEFLFSNTMLLVLFGVMSFAGLRVRRHAGWHRRLMLTAMSILSGPGLGRLLPMPLLMPHSWRIMMLVTLVFPIAGMIRDRMRTGRVHPAWLYGVSAIIVVQIVADLIAYSGWGVEITNWIVAGTAGAERPIEAFLPPGL